MTNQHRREGSIPHVRLTQPLPPLPLNELPPRLSIATQIPYRDEPEEDEEELLSAHSARSPSQPPRYEPMYDYLRARQQMTLQVPPTCTHPNLGWNPQNSSEEPYRDEPFVVTIVDSEDVDVSQPPPPSYNELYQQNQIEMENLRQQFDIEGTPAEQTEEICKWVVAMLLITLTIACVGTAFNWGQPSCSWPNKSAGSC